MQQINPNISKEKFALEVGNFVKAGESYRKRGIFLLYSDFPNVIVLFSATQLKPAAIVFAVRINYDNYDLEPLSVRFIDPFTWEESMPPHPFWRKDENGGPMQLAQQDAPNPPFICLPGIREYHNHPFHSGNSWLLHRQNGGEGTLGFIVDKLYDYGIVAINAYQLVVASKAANLSIDINAVPS